MAGGTGSRLWPVSRSMYPKQFQALTEPRTMLQVTAQRVAPLTDRRPLLICNEDHRSSPPSRCAGSIRRARSSSSRWSNTAPRSHWPRYARPRTMRTPITGTGGGPPDPGRGWVPSKDRGRSPCVAEAGVSWSRSGSCQVSPRDRLWLYKTRGDSADAESTGFMVSGFVEKPDLGNSRGTTSTDLVIYLWNSGIFLFRACPLQVIEELGSHRPDILDPCRPGDGGHHRRPGLPQGR